MNIDDILAEHKKWIGTIAEQAANGRASEAQLKYPDEFRQQRMFDLEARIGSMTARRDEMTKLYDSAIGQDKQEYEALKASERWPIPKRDSPVPNDQMGPGSAGESPKSKR